MGMGRYLSAAIALILIFSAGCLDQEHLEKIGSPAENHIVPAGCGMLEIHVLNVSQADAILIITPSNKTILIDSGSAMKKDSASKAVDYLKNMGIKRIDYLIATHYHEDHIGGMESIASSFDIGEIYHNGDCGDYKSAVAGRFVNLTASHDSTVVVSDMDLPADPCLAQERLIVAYDRPEGCWPSGSDTSNENENSILFRMVYGNTSFLFAGDCEAGCEQELIRQGTFLRSDVLKVGHHGSETSSSDKFLDAVSAERYVISTDRTRSVIDGYFHPRQESLSRIYAHGGWEETYRTDLEGDISVLSDGRSITVLEGAKADDCGIFSGFSSAQSSSYGRIPGLFGKC